MVFHGRDRHRTRLATVVLGRGPSGGHRRRTGGLGRAIALFLVERGARVTVVGRTFRDQGVAGLDFIAADVESVAEAGRVADALPAEDLDALILTSGTISTPEREASTDGIERDMAVSYVSRFVILRALADRLGANRARRPRVFVMGFPGTGEKGDPADLNAEKNYKQMPAHMNTVAANEAMVLDAARRFPRLAVFGLNPGSSRPASEPTRWAATRVSDSKPWRP